MNRVIAAVAGLATAATATTVFATALVPARAATRPAGTHPAAHARTHAAPAARRPKTAAAPATVIASELDHGKYMTVIKCSGGAPPKPIRLAVGAVPMTVRGSGSAPAPTTTRRQPKRYKTIYSCTVTVQLKSPVIRVTKKKHPTSKRCVVCSKTVTLSTGFGGLATKVAGHHPGR